MLTSLPGGWSRQGTGTSSCPHGSVVFGCGPRVRAEEGTEECAWVKRTELRGCLGGLAWLSSQRPSPPLWAHVLWDQGRQLLELPADWAKALQALESCLLLLPPSSLSHGHLLPTLLPAASRPQDPWLGPKCLLNRAGPGTGQGAQDIGVGGRQIWDLVSSSGTNREFPPLSGPQFPHLG